MTQKQLAIAVDCAQSAIVYWESDRQEPTVTNLKKICKALDVSADYLLGLDETDE